MDISTLSRQLNMSVHELRSKMRGAGFRVSPRARKVNNNVAKEIVRKLSGKPEVEQATETTVKNITVEPTLMVKELAFKLEQPVTAVIKKLIENGVMATINEEIDAETAMIVASEFGVEAEIQKATEGSARIGLGFVSDLIAKEEAQNLVVRPPVVAVMGHVDHGKTTLLDKLRKTDVVATESGAITQHIGAYQIEHQGKKITFLDTPGHEAFAAMRARGANVTDLIVLVVAADDSVKPQTVEVINRAKLTKTPLIVAINKIDKPDANPERVKGDLANLGVNIEEWGGKVPAIPISAKAGTNLDKLLETILLVAEVEELKANPKGKILGTVIESHLSRGQGPVATVLVQNGTLHVGDIVMVGRTFGRIKSMHDAVGGKQKQAEPSRPVQIAGISDVAEAGDILQVFDSLDEARKTAGTVQKMHRAKRLKEKPLVSGDPNQRELKLIIRADVAGSLEAILEALEKLKNDDVNLVIVDSLAAEISESDVQLAENTKSTIIGFHTKVSGAAVKLAKQKHVNIDQYEVIYELLENVTSAMLELMPMEVVVDILGRVKIKAVFRTEKTNMIVGGEVIEGKIVDKKNFKIMREKQEIGSGKTLELQQNKIEVEEVGEGREFGLKVKTSIPIQAGDILEIFDETVKRKDLQT